MDKQIIKDKIQVEFKESFDSCSKKKTIWRSKDNIPIYDCKLNFNYIGGCDRLEFYINGETVPSKILYPGETYTKKYPKLTSIDIYCAARQYTKDKKDPCNCLPKRTRWEPCCSFGEFTIYTYKKCKPKKSFPLELILFVLLVIISCSCRNRYYPMY